MGSNSISPSLCLVLQSLVTTTAFHSPHAFERDTDGHEEVSEVPAPLSIAPSQYWDGIDGQWSSFTQRLGTPEQLVRTFVSFSIYQNLAVLPQGCQGSANESTCADARGWIFDPDDSSTFQEIGIYDTWVGSDLGYQTNAKYGFEAVGLGSEAADGPTLANTTLGGMAAESYYLGFFGLSPEPTNFSTFGSPTTSYMVQLKEQGMIPSLSFSYTAGAHYRFGGTFGSLTLGGYDTSRYDDNNITFTMTSGYERDVKVVVQSITTSSIIGSSHSDTELLPRPVIAMIDPTFPEIWLPEEVCEAFEREFGLIFDNTTELYLVNKTLHKNLLARNANVTFTMGQDLYGSENVKITLPYAAFDLKAQPPFRTLDKESNYFPLRRADGTGRYGIVLGRTFLQEAYITVDYEAYEFRLAQIAWSDAGETNLVAIPSGNGSLSSSSSETNVSSTSHPILPDSDERLRSGAIAGAVVGPMTFIALIAGLLLHLHRRRRHHRRTFKSGNEQDSDKDLNGNSKRVVFVKAELAGSSPMASPKQNGEDECVSQSPDHGFQRGISELPSAPLRQPEIWELPGDLASVCEKDSKTLSEKETMLFRERVYNGVDTEVKSLPTALKQARLPQKTRIASTGTAGATESTRMHRAFSFEVERTESII